MDLAAAAHHTELVMRKQDKLLVQGFRLLLNLAEDVHIERKMTKRGIVKLLGAPLPCRCSCSVLRTAADAACLHAVLASPQFRCWNGRTTTVRSSYWPSTSSGTLRCGVAGALSPICVLTVAPSVVASLACSKLSIFEENMREMSSLGVVGYLARLVPVNQEALLSSVLRLLYNLSFEPSQQSAMVAAGLVPKLVGAIPLVPLRPTVLRVLYHIRCVTLLHPRLAGWPLLVLLLTPVGTHAGSRVQHGRALNGCVRFDARHTCHRGPHCAPTSGTTHAVDCLHASVACHSDSVSCILTFASHRNSRCRRSLLRLASTSAPSTSVLRACWTETALGSCWRELWKRETRW